MPCKKPPSRKEILGSSSALAFKAMGSMKASSPEEVRFVAL